MKAVGCWHIHSFIDAISISADLFRTATRNVSLQPSYTSPNTPLSLYTVPCIAFPLPHLPSSISADFKVKLRVKTGSRYEKRKMVDIFQNPKWKQEYAIEINNKFEILENLDKEDSIDNDINGKWENIKTRIKETKQQLTEKEEGTETFKNKRYDEECKFAIEKMKIAREKWLTKGRWEKEEQEYYHKRKDHKIIRNKKKKHT
jgi:hypothetical protein